MISCHEVAFTKQQEKAAPAQEERERVLAVVAEADDPEYWFSASKDGNREQHYRGKPFWVGKYNVHHVVHHDDT